MSSFSDIESPAVNTLAIEELKTNTKRTGICTGFALVFGFIGFIMAAAAVAGVRQLMIESHEHSAILTVGNASPLKGFRKAHSLYAGSGSWTSKKNLPVPLSDYQAVSHKTHVYIIGGQKGCNGTQCSGTVVDTVYQYDTKLDKYTAKASMPEKRYRYASAVVGDKIYIIGGLTADTVTGMLKTTLIYDITNDSWSSDGPELAEGRSDTCAGVVDGKIYVVAGYNSIDPVKVLDTVEVLDTKAATPAWATAPKLPAPRGDVTCASAGGKVYAIGGYYDPAATWSATAFADTMYELTPGAAAWAEKAKMPSSRGDKAAVTMSDGSIIVVGGETHAREQQSQVAAHPVEQYYPAHNTWVAKASIPTARFRFGAAVVDDIVYAIGGHRVCETEYPENAAPITDCAEKTLDSVEALLDVAHPDIWVHTN